MRRWLTALALAGVTTMLTTGCVRPAGIDGDPVDDWPALAIPQVFVPATDVCLPRVAVVVQPGSYEPVDCASPHLAETIHVGTFTGADADRTTRPPAGSPALRAARAECDRRAGEVLGGDWHAGRLALSVALPSASAWPGGARWFRCDLSVTDSLDNTKPVIRTGSLRGALLGDSPLRHGCFDPKMIGDSLNYMQPVPCTTPHRAEFVGVHREQEMSWVDFDAAGDRVHRRCLTLVARFAKVPDNSDLSYRAGSIYYPPSQEEWEAGDRGVRCFLWSHDRQLTRSMRGVGPKGLPAS